MPAKSLLGLGQAEAPQEQAPPSGQGACLGCMWPEARVPVHFCRAPCAPRAVPGALCSQLSQLSLQARAVDSVTSPLFCASQTESQKNDSPEVARGRAGIRTQQSHAKALAHNHDAKLWEELGAGSQSGPLWPCHLHPFAPEEGDCTEMEVICSGLHSRVRNWGTGSPIWGFPLNTKLVL